MQLGYSAARSLNSAARRVSSVPAVDTGVGSLLHSVDSRPVLCWLPMAFDAWTNGDGQAHPVTAISMALVTALRLSFVGSIKKGPPDWHDRW